MGCLLPTSLGGDIDPTAPTTIPEGLALCSEDDDPLNCAESNRFCVDNTTSNEKFCGPCINGTIEDFTALDDVEYPCKSSRHSASQS